MKRLSSVLREKWHRYCITLLNVCWILGISSGILVAVSSREYLTLITWQAVIERMSISGLLVVTVLPFLFSAYAVLLSEPWLLPIVGALKAFGVGYCACGVSLVFGQSGWLIRLLLLFSDCFAAPLLYLFSLRHISGRLSQVRQDVAVIAVLMAVVGLVDYSVVSTFLARLFS